MDPILISEESVPLQTHLNGGLAMPYRRLKVSLRADAEERMTVWMLIPPGAGPFPAILACHQTVAEGKDEPIGFGGNYLQLNFGPFLASRGFVVLAVDSPAAGERITPAIQYPYHTSALEGRDPTWSILNQRLRDHRRVFDYLETLPYQPVEFPRFPNRRIQQAVLVA